MRLTIIMPVLNEQATLRASIDRVRSAELPGEIEMEILVVDDGSTDGSMEILADEAHAGDLLVFRNPHTLGKGVAVQTGIAQATGDILLIQDAGLECDPSEYPDLIGPIVAGEQAIVCGSRFTGSPQAVLRQPGVRNMLSLTARLLYGAVLTDMETCVWAFRADSVKGIRLRSSRSGFGLEITAKLLKRGHRILEVPISYWPRYSHHHKKTTWRDGPLAFWTLIKYRFVD